MDSEAYLIKEIATGEKDEYGDAIIEHERTEVYVSEKSVARSEFYVAQTAGFDPEIILVLSDYLDYDNQTLIEYNETLYKIIRTYRINSDELELTCSHVKENENGQIST